MSEIDESWRECGADGQEGVGAMLDFRCICRVVDWRDILQLVRTIPSACTYNDSSLAAGACSNYDGLGLHELVDRVASRREASGE